MNMDFFKDDMKLSEDIVNLDKTSQLNLTSKMPFGIQIIA